MLGGINEIQLYGSDRAVLFQHTIEYRPPIDSDKADFFQQSRAEQKTTFNGGVFALGGILQEFFRGERASYLVCAIFRMYVRTYSYVYAANPGRI